MGGLYLKIYLDVCCLNRPFDDLTQERICLEAEAIMAIVSRCEKGSWTLLSSGAIDAELSKLSDMHRLGQVRALYDVARERVYTNPYAEKRAAVLRKLGLKPFDSLHVALAEACNANVFLTTDDRLLKAANRIDTNVKISNPLLWLMEVMSYGH